MVGAFASLAAGLAAGAPSYHDDTLCPRSETSVQDASMCGPDVSLRSDSAQDGCRDYHKEDDGKGHDEPRHIFALARRHCLIFQAILVLASQCWREAVMVGRKPLPAPVPAPVLANPARPENATSEMAAR